MATKRPTLAELVTQYLNDLYRRFEVISRPARFSFNKVYAMVTGAAVYLIYGKIDANTLRSMPDTATGTDLERWTIGWDIQRKNARKAEGNIIFSGNDGALVPAFSKVQTNDNFIFQTLYDAVIQAGKSSVKIESLTTGTIGNLKGGTILNLVSPISNIKSECILDEYGTFNGSDVEKDELLRGRMYDRIRNPYCGGNKYDYEIWCKQIPGVTRAWCYPQYLGDGNVGLSFVRDNDENIIPNEPQIQEVIQYISALMPCDLVALKVFPPKAYEVQFTIKSNNLTDEFKNQIKEQLKYLFFNIAIPSGMITISDILESLSIIKTTSQTPVRFSLISPSQDIILDDKSVGIVGNITLEGF
jgi:uncharacterized phage protein gp47/JayE